VCLSLVNTAWYIQEMKSTPYYPEAKPVPISLSDARIERIQPIRWESRRMELPVPRDVFAQFGVTDTALINAGRIEFQLKNTLQFGDVKAIRIQDQMVQDIVFTNQWKRPVYFAVTVSPDSKIGLDEYLWFDGLALRLEPRKATEPERGLNAGILEQNLFHEPQGFSKTPQYGYKFRNIANPDVSFDENTIHLMLNYRSAVIRLALYHVNVDNDTAKSVATLDRMETIVPRSKIPMGWELTFDLAFFYHRLGREDKFNEIASEVEPICKNLIETGQINANSYYNPYRALLDIYEARKEYPKSLDILNRLAALYPNDPSIKNRIAELQARLKPSDTTKVAHPQ
jgi:hypothetical protein